MKAFLLGMLCGFVITVMILALYACLVAGGDKHE